MRKFADLGAGLEECQATKAAHKLWERRPAQHQPHLRLLLHPLLRHHMESRAACCAAAGGLERLRALALQRWRAAEADQAVRCEVATERWRFPLRWSQQTCGPLVVLGTGTEARALSPLACRPLCIAHCGPQATRTA